MVLDHRSTPIRKMLALVIVYSTMIITHFPDDDMCRRNNGGIWQRLFDITTAAALRPRLLYEQRIRPLLRVVNPLVRLPITVKHTLTK